MAALGTSGSLSGTLEVGTEPWGTQGPLVGGEEVESHPRTSGAQRWMKGDVLGASAQQTEAKVMPPNHRTPEPQPVISAQESKAICILERALSGTFRLKTSDI